MPKRNYAYEKRQKELNRQRKKAEKLQRRLDRTSDRGEAADPGEISEPESRPDSTAP